MLRMEEGKPDPCQRRRVLIEGEHFYIVVGKNFVTATVPDENKYSSKKLRTVVTTLCKEITAAMGGETL